MRAVYLRCSTDMQAQNNGVDSQRFQVRCLFAARGWDYAAAHEYIDEGTSGATMDRPAVAQLMAAIGAGLVGTVVVFDMDRLSRDPDDRSAFLKLCKAKSVQVCEARGDLDTSTAEGQLMERVRAAVSEYERAKIRQRVRAGVQAKIASGQPWGGARVMQNRRGTTAGCSRLTQEQWDTARQRLAAGEPASKVAPDYGVGADALLKRVSRAVRAVR